jgi:O-antigen/teichoic acid export membrane protein
VCGAAVRSPPQVVGRFRKNFIADSSATAAGLVAQLLLIVVLARVLDTRAYSGYILAASLVAVGEMCSDFGTRMWAIRQTALGMDLRAGLRPILLTKLAYTALFAAGVALLVGHTIPAAGRCLIVAIAFLQPSTDPILWQYRGREQLYVDASITFAWRVGAAMLMLLAAWLSRDLILTLAAWLIANVTRVALEIAWLRLRAPPAAAQPHAAPSHAALELPSAGALIREVFPIGCAFVLMSLYQRVGVFALSRISDATAVAVYGTSFSLVTVPGFFAVSVSSALLPRLSRSVHTRSFAEATGTLDRGLALIAALSAALCLAGVMAAPWVFDLLLPARYYEGHLVMQILLPGLYVSSLSVLLKFCLNALSLNTHDAVASGLGIVVFVLVMVVPHWSVPSWGAAFAWNVGELSIFIARALVMARDGRLRMGRVVRLGLLYAVLALVCYPLGRAAEGLHAQFPLHRLWGAS